MLFSDRLLIAISYQEWADKNHVKVCYETLIAYMQINALLDEEKCKEFIKKLKEQNNDN